MTQISSTHKSVWLTPRTANYVAAIIREGDSFDYCKWLQQVRGEKTQAKELRQATTKQIVSEEIGIAVSTFPGRETSLNARVLNGRVPIPIGMTRSRLKTLHSSSGARIRWRFEKIRDAWNDFQASRTRDAVYGYLSTVFETVIHYKVRRRTRKLLRHAFEFSELPFYKNANPFTAVIRCTSDDTVDSKTISKWARALRYVAHCKIPRIDSTEEVYERGRRGQRDVPMCMRNVVGGVPDESYFSS
jgi:hypothetical protein